MKRHRERGRAKRVYKYGPCVLALTLLFRPSKYISESQVFEIARDLQTCTPDHSSSLPVYWQEPRHKHTKPPSPSMEQVRCRDSDQLRRLCSILHNRRSERVPQLQHRFNSLWILHIPRILCRRFAEPVRRRSRTGSRPGLWDLLEADDTLVCQLIVFTKHVLTGRR